MSVHYSRIALATITLALAAGGAFAALAGDGAAGGEVGQLIEITVSDGTVTSYAEFTPTAGSETVRLNTGDGLTFSNGASNVQALWDYTVTASFTKDHNGAVSTTTLGYQGTTTTLTDLVYLAQASSSDFLPWKTVTGADLTSQGATGWTSHADCASVTYQGSLSVPYYSNGGVAQTALVRYYQVCDTATEIYVGATKDMSAGDKAIIQTQTSTGASATAANYEVTIQNTDFVFASAASATTVTLKQGQFVDLGASSNTASAWVLLKFPNGFPAGAFTATVRATASDIVTG